MGRPLKELDEEQVADLAARGASNREIGDILGCDHKTIASRFSPILDKKRAERRMALREAQFKTALAGNATMLIWLGKNELDQRDTPTPDDNRSSEMLAAIKSVEQKLLGTPDANGAAVGLGVPAPG